MSSEAIIGTATKALFEPFDLGGLRLRNRLAFTAVASTTGVEGIVTDEMMDFYERRAAGGVGLVITEGMTVHRSSRPHPSVPQVYNSENQPLLRALTDRVHAHGAAIFMQLWHVGRQQLWGPSVVPWGMSARPDPLSGVVPHVMTSGEVRELIQSYVDGAVVAEKAGFDGIEIHGAHGYLVTQSMSPWSNDREDEYGGTAVKRRRMLEEILRGIRSATRDNFIVAIKITGVELVPGGLTVEDMRPIVQGLVAQGLVDLVTTAQGNFSVSLDAHVPDLTFPPAPFREVIVDLAGASGEVPTMAVGRITSQQMAADYLETPGIELIGLGRPLLSDPDLPNKWAGTDPELVRECTFCNGCWESARAGRGLTCMHNPDVVNSPVPIQLMRRQRESVHVVGGGPAGMEVAWVAASRGHSVRLSEASHQLGGQLRHLASLPHLTDYRKVLDYQVAQLQRYGVKVELDTKIEPQSHQHPDRSELCVLATGATPQALPTALADYQWPLRMPEEVLGERVPTDLVLIDEDGGWYGYGEVLRECERGASATIVTPEFSVGSKLGLLATTRLERLLRKHHVQVVTGHQIAASSSDGLTFIDVCTLEELGLARPDLLIYAGPRVARDSLWRSADPSDRSCLVVGDAMAPRDLRAAILQGRELAESF